jgi:argininosuccinate synthase
MFSEKITTEKVGICVSGGLSSLTVAAALAESGAPATALVADIGQVAHDELCSLARSLEAIGIPTIIVDLRDRMAEMAFDLVRYLAKHDGGYWNTTGASRLVLVEGLGAAMRRAGCTVLAHGCVDGGNDQRRFERYAAALLPDLRVFVPWQEKELLRRFPDRSAMETYVLERGLALTGGCSAHNSIDGSLAGFSHEGTALESLETPDSRARLLLTVPPQRAPDQAEKVAVRFVHGQPVEIDGAALAPQELIERANSIAGRHGIGLRGVVENRINGTKCRSVYEAPGLDLLGFCVSKVYQVAIDVEARQLLESLSDLIGHGVYEARYLDTAVRAARAAADVILEPANTTVEVELYKGSMSFLGIFDHSGTPLLKPLPLRQTRFTGSGQSWQVIA